MAGTNREASRLGINLAPTRASQQERGAIDVEFSDKDSRPLFCTPRAEELASQLRQLEVKNFVMHSSLSQEQRRRAEQEFVAGEDCVIVATSALELGVDVGDLDRVIQIDAPSTVSSFLQRTGRTGRRPSTQRNCLFLATADEPLLQSAALIDLWSRGFVEPVVPPPEPLHIFAQQLMALALQENGIGRSAWRDWVGSMPAFAALSENETAAVIDHMIEKDIFWSDNGILWFGKEGEDEFGARHFMDLLSVFTSEPLFTVRHGRSDLGFVHQLSFASKPGDKTILLLGGRNWAVNHLDWRQHVAYVEPTDEPGRSRWIGVGQPLHFELCQAIRRTLTTDQLSERYSKRAAVRVDQLRKEMWWVSDDRTSVVAEGEARTWWTFGGARANAAIAHHLSEQTGRDVDSGNLAIVLPTSISLEDLDASIQETRRQDATSIHVPVSDDAVEELKFSSCLPRSLARHVLELRLADRLAIQSVLRESVRYTEQDSGLQPLNIDRPH